MKIKVFLAKSVVILCVLLMWEIIVSLGVIKAYIIPPPSRISHTFFTLLANKDFLIDIWISLERVIISLMASIILGSFLGMAMGYFKKAQIFIQPLVEITQPIPKIMLFPIFIVLFGFSELSRVLFMTLGCLYVMIYAAYQGAKHIDSTYIDAAKSLGASDFRIFTSVIVPYSLPYIAGGIKSAVGLSLILMFFSETLGAKRGLGYFVMFNWSWFNMEKVFAGIIVASIIGVLIVKLVELIEKRVLIWKTSK